MAMIAPMMMANLTQLTYVPLATSVTASVTASVVQDFFLHLFLHPEAHTTAVMVLAGGAVVPSVGLAFLSKELFGKIYPPVKELFKLNLALKA